MDILCVARAEPVWRNCGITVAVSINETAVQMRHHAHVISKRRQTRIHWNPVRIKFRKVTGVTDIERCVALRDDSHAERPSLTTESRTIVIRPERCRREVGMQLPCNLSLRERVLIHSTWR